MLHGYHVAHDGSGQGEAGNNGCLGKAGNHEQFDGCRKGGGISGEDENAKSGKEHRTASVSVGQRANDQLEQGCHAQIGRNCQLHDGIIGIEIGCHCRKGRQNQIYVQSTHTGYQDKRQDVGRGVAFQKTRILAGVAGQSLNLVHG